jgi:hypothetical protein
LKLLLKAANGSYLTYDTASGASLTANQKLAYCFPSVEQADAASHAFSDRFGPLAVEPLDKVPAPELQPAADSLSAAAGQMPTDDTPPLFELGRVVATPGALAALISAGADPLALLHRHATGDWLSLDKHDRAANVQALTQGSRIFSTYQVTPGLKVWLITEADRSSTCLLLPREY